MATISVDDLHRSEGLALRRFLLRVLGDPSDAADAAQETYLRFVKALTRSEIEHPRIFLFFIARNVAATLGQRRRLEATLFRPLSEVDLDALDPRARTEQQVIARQQLRLVAAAVDEMPPRRREVFLLSVLDGFANGEIAARLGVTRNMVEKHLMKALLHTRRRCSEFF